MSRESDSSGVGGQITPIVPMHHYGAGAVLKEEGCCHEYDEAWVCKICGYQLPGAITNKIRRVGEGTKK